MKFDVTKEIRRLDGTPFTFEVLGLPEKDDDDPFSFRDVLVDALLNRVEIDGRDPRTGIPLPKKMSGKDKFSRYRLAEKISDNKVLEIDTNEIDLIKECTSVLSPELVGRLWKFLEDPVLEEPVVEDPVADN